MSIRGTARGRWAAVALLVAGALVIGGLQLVGRGSDDAVDTADLDSIRAAVPDLLAGACLLGTVPLEDDMGGTELDHLVDAKLASLHDDVRAVYSEEAAAALEPGLRDLLDGMHQGRDVPVSRLGCTFEPERFETITVRSGDAEAQVAGAFHQVVGAPTSTELDYGPRDYVVTLVRAGGTWLLVEFHEEPPPESS